MANLNQPILERMRAIILSKACQRINFNPGGSLPINADLYKRLAVILHNPGFKDNHLDVETDPNPAKPAGAEASYSIKRNTFYLPRWWYADLQDSKEGRLPFEKMTIVHECTHAAVDLLKTPIYWLYAESSAYIAGALYNLYCGSPWKPSEDQYIFVEAARVADEIKDKPGVTSINTSRLHFAIQQDENYKIIPGNTHYYCDGIPEP